jgi:hypothetical protein
MTVNIESALKNLVRVGTVSSVDADDRVARVAFMDKLDEAGEPLVSGRFKVLQTQPLITVEKWVMELGAAEKYDYEAYYNSHPRELGLGEEYVKMPYNKLRDIIKNEKVIKYEKREVISEGSPITVNCDSGCEADSCPLEGIIEYKKHWQEVTVYPWLPYVGQLVVCLYIPNGESDGFILGGI